MNKNELIASVAEKAEISNKDADVAVKAVTEVLAEALAQGDKISLVGFGTFSVRERAARSGINPLTKEKMEIAAAKVPAFKAGSVLKDAVK